MKPKDPTADQVIAKIGTLRDILVGDIIPAPWWSTIRDRHPPGVFRSTAVVAATFIAPGPTPTAPHQDSNSRGSSLLAPILIAQSTSIISHIVALHGGVAPSL